MTVKKLSQITVSPSNLMTSDHLVGVTAANADVLFTPAQVAAGTGAGLTVGTTTVTGGTDNYALTVGGGTLGETPIRIPLIANTNYYVAITGSDSNNGSIGSPWATLQHAVNFITSSIDINGFDAIIQLADGSYVGAVIGSVTNSSSVSVSPTPGIVIQGNAADASKVSLTERSGGNILGVGCGPQAGVFLKNLTIDGSVLSSNTIVVYAYGAGTVLGIGDGTGGTIRCLGAASTGDFLTAGNQAVLSLSDTIEMHGSPGVWIRATFGGAVEIGYNYTTCNFKFYSTTGATFCSADGTGFDSIAFNGVILFAAATFTDVSGTYSQTPGNWSVVGNGYIITSALSSPPPLISVGGALSSGGAFNYQDAGANLRYIRAQQEVEARSLAASVTTSNLTTSFWDFFKDTRQPAGLGGVFKYNDAGTIVTLNRQILIANANFYVTTTGSDSNPGTLASPWATIQHALNVISATLDIAGFNVEIHIGAGSFAPAFILATIGGGQIQFTGAGTASTTITAVFTGSGCLYWPFSSSTVFGMTDITFDNSNGAAAALNINAYVNVSPGDIFGTGTDTLAFANTGAGNQPIIFAQGASVIFPFATMTVTGTWAAIYAISSFALVTDFSPWTMSSTPTFGGAAATVSAGGAYLNFGASFTGAATGTRFQVSSGSIIETFGGGPNFFPGNAAGTIDSSSSYDGVVGSNVNYNIPITGFTFTMANDDTDLILDPAGTLAAGTVKMAAVPFDGQFVTIRTSQIITSLVINGNGATVAGYTTGTLGLGGFLTAIYKASNTTWYF